MNQTTAQNTSHRFPLGIEIGIIAVLALLVRLIYIVQLSKTPFFAHPVVDGHFFDSWARQIDLNGWGTEGVYFRAPLYAYLLAFIYSVAHTDFWAARIVQSFLGTATAVLTFVLAYQLTGRRSIARISGILVAINGILIFHDGELLAESLLTPLIVASAVIYAWNTRRKAWYLNFLCGLTLGLACITRPTALVLLPVYLLDQAWLTRLRDKTAKLTRQLLLAGVLAFGWALPVAPVTLHNLYKGDTVLIATHGGLNFYAGNCYLADGSHGVIPGIGLDWNEQRLLGMASKAEGRWLKPSEADHCYYRKGLEYIRQHPIAWIKLTIKKVFAFWTRLEISDNRDLEVFRDETGIMPFLRVIGFWLIGPLGILGVWLGWRRQWLPLWYVLIILAFVAGYAAYLVVSRYRVPLLPFIILAAAIAVITLYENRSKLFERERINHLVILGAAFIFVNVNFWGIKASYPAHAYYSLGVVYLEMKADIQAKYWFEKALEEDPTWKHANLNLGIIAHRHGDLDAAEKAFKQELRIYPTEVRALNNIGMVRIDQGRYDEAIELFQKVLKMDFDTTKARSTKSQIFYALGMQRASEGDLLNASTAFKRALTLDPQKATYYYSYALAVGRLGEVQEAIEALKQALQLYPDFTAARELLMNVQEELSQQ